MEDEAGFEWFGVAEIQEIFEVTIGTDISDEDGGQSEWSLAECQELLGEEMSEKTRLHGSVEIRDKPMESLNKLPPDTTENFDGCCC